MKHVNETFLMQHRHESAAWTVDKLSVVHQQFPAANSSAVRTREARGATLCQHRAVASRRAAQVRKCKKKIPLVAMRSKEVDGAPV
jgi:hypothetical protein